MTLRRVTIDLTPLLPGGDNGGAKLIACSLVQQFAELAPETEFILFTSAISHVELAELEAPNVRRHCTDADSAPVQVDSGALGGARAAARVLVNTFMPPGARERVKDGVWTFVKRQRRAQTSKSLIADLHFAPFTAPFFFDQRVPLVSLIHDLQFADHPEFFDDETRTSREGHFQEASLLADRLICVSDFVRETVLAHSHRPPETVTTVHSTVIHATAADPNAPAIAHGILQREQLRSSRYLLYPANAWPHKNHRRLVEAFALYLNKHPNADLALLCSGAPGPGFNELQSLASASLSRGAFGFVGYLSERDYAALLQNSRALIFPSLYEGFGLPVLEAMGCDRPVLCSNITSLPEVVGDAALLFDPHDAESIADAIEQLETDSKLEHTLIERGRRRLERFGSARDMAARYLAVFEDVRSRAATR